MIQEINLPKIIDKRGNLTFLQEGIGLPFEIKRVFWTYDVPSGEKRGGHAFRNQKEVICVVSGSVDIVLTFKNGKTKIVTLNRPEKALYVPNNVWRHLENFATNTVTLHFSDSSYNPNDYIRNIKDL